MRKWRSPDAAASHGWKVNSSNYSTTGISTRYFEFSLWDPFGWPFGLSTRLNYKVLNHFSLAWVER